MQFFLSALIAPYRPAKSLAMLWPIHSPLQKQERDPPSTQYTWYSFWLRINEPPVRISEPRFLDYEPNASAQKWLCLNRGGVV
jgi:hypothetical protein